MTRLKMMSMEELSRLIRNEGEPKSLRECAQRELTTREDSLFNIKYSKKKNIVSGYAFANLDYVQ